MYLRDKKIRLLHIKNILFTIIGVFELFASWYYIIAEFVYYRDDPYTALHARSMPECFVWVILSTFMLVNAAVSRYRIGNATFYSSYFEGDLDGYISCTDLAEVTGRSAEKVKKQLLLYLKRYMRKFELKEENGEASAELFSKKTLCECRTCGAHIEKRIYFTGVCPYCESSDLSARVLTDERFYSISNDFRSGMKKPAYYTAKFLKLRQVLGSIGFVLLALLAFIGFCMTIDGIHHYFDHDYQRDILMSPDNHLFSYELIKADILDGIIGDILLFLVMLPCACLTLAKIISGACASVCAKHFSKCSKPFVRAGSLPPFGIIDDENKKRREMRRAIHRGYLCHCTLEMHNGELMAALAKKIVKDQCPSCAAPITGAVDENYVCQYCGNQIMGVIKKR